MCCASSANRARATYLTTRSGAAIPFNSTEVMRQACRRYARSRLSEFATDHRVFPQTDNRAVRMILGQHSRIPAAGPISSADVDALAYEACERLDEIGYTDLLERGESMYVDLERWFGSPLKRNRVNTTKHGQGPPVDVADLIDRRTLALVNDRCAADLQLWHHVAQQRGLLPSAACSIADTTFASSVPRNRDCSNSASPTRCWPAYSVARECLVERLGQTSTTTGRGPK